MSETVHYRGVAKEIKPTKDQTIEQVAEKLCIDFSIPMDDFTRQYENSSWIFLLLDAMEDEFISIQGVLYKMATVRVEVNEDIIRAERLPNGDISYELKYYNGGAEFKECLEEAFNKLK